MSKTFIFWLFLSVLSLSALPLPRFRLENRLPRPRVRNRVKILKETKQHTTYIFPDGRTTKRYKNYGKWRNAYNTPIKYYLDLSNLPESLSDRSNYDPNQTQTKTKLNLLLKQACNIWQNEAKINFIQTFNEKEAEMRVMFKNKSHNHYNGQACIKFQTYQAAHAFQINSFEWDVKRYDERGFDYKHISGDIHLNSELEWVFPEEIYRKRKVLDFKNLLPNGQPNKSKTQYFIFNDLVNIFPLLVHEIGHVLGFHHVLDDVREESIMRITPVGDFKVSDRLPEYRVVLD